MKIGPIKLGIIIIVIWAAIGFLPLFISDSSTDRGTFGDMFGSVNSLFSGLALAGVIYAIFLQKRELELQRNELELTRLELKRSADAQSISSDSLQKQINLLALSSKLSAYSALIQSCDDRISAREAAARGSDASASLAKLFPRTHEISMERKKHELALIETLEQIDRITSNKPVDPSG